MNFIGKGGGGQRIRLFACTECHYLSIMAWVKDPLNGPGSSKGLYALSSYLNLVFKHSDTKWATDT